MNLSEDSPLSRFGTPLEPLEEDEVPSKKKMVIKDQIVTDENGKRRFHGAFTGGFSAGFWNTVGSLEGWKPQGFKSSRHEKAVKPSRQLPTDFMDDEDLGEFGIAPQRIQAREDFVKTDSLSVKRSLTSSRSCPIPGIPVLQQLLEPAKEKVASRLLRRMGWKPGQGVGARQTQREKRKSNRQNNIELYLMKMYGCTVKRSENAVEEENSFQQGLDESEDDADEITFAPDDFEPFVCSMKDNVFGLGYTGLYKRAAKDSNSHINLFGPLEVIGKANKKLSIRGQAFGVGALEEEDEDIYARDDMTNYDFSLEDTRIRKKKKLTQNQFILKGFAETTIKANIQKMLNVTELKANFQPRNWSQRKSRFEPLPEEKSTLLKIPDVVTKKGLGRHDLDPNERGYILDGTNQKANTVKKSYLQHISEKYKEREKKSERLLQFLSSKEDNFMKGGLVTSTGIEVMEGIDVSPSVKSENQFITSKAKEITNILGNSTELFIPFAANAEKQKRYENFIAANLSKEDDIKSFLATIQPLHLSEWDKEMELKEFIQAQRIYKPLDGSMSKRFVSKSNADISPTPIKISDEKKKMNVIRVKNLWKPCALMCKRFNVPEPFGGTLVEPKDTKRNKFSVFDYIENSINSKKDFVTPVIIPKYVEKPKEIQKENIKTLKNLTSNADSIDVELGNVLAKPVAEINSSTKNLININKHKTELELKVEESKHKHPSEKKDLFKCIFESSDEEDESEKIDKNANKNIETFPNDVAQLLMEPSPTINVLKNNSPPRGIFAVLSKPEKKNVPKNEDLNINKKITFMPKSERSLEANSAVEHFSSLITYGPKIPTDLKPQSSMEVKKSEQMDKKIVKLLSAKPIEETKIIEKWVEKKVKSSKKDKKKKKQKKFNREHEIKTKKSKKHKK